MSGIISYNVCKKHLQMSIFSLSSLSDVADYFVSPKKMTPPSPNKPRNKLPQSQNKLENSGL